MHAYFSQHIFIIRCISAQRLNKESNPGPFGHKPIARTTGPPPQPKNKTYLMHGYLRPTISRRASQLFSFLLTLPGAMVDTILDFWPAAAATASAPFSSLTPPTFFSLTIFSYCPLSTLSWLSGALTYSRTRILAEN